MLELYDTLILFSKENPVVAGVIGIWIAGITTFFLRTVPFTVFRFIKNQCITTLSVSSQDAIYFELLEWVSEKKLSSFIRTLNYSNKGLYGYGEEKISIGYGTSVFMFGWCPIWMFRKKEDAQGVYVKKETISLVMLGRNHKTFTNLFQHILNHKQKDPEELGIYTNDEGHWSMLGTFYKRPLSSVFIKEKEKIVECIERFIQDKEWYRENGIPYKLGVLLYGPPGTGKSSMIRAIASKYNKPIYSISLSTTNDKNISRLMMSAPAGSIIAIEDIDAQKLNRGEQEEQLTLSGILNAIDGAVSSDDRILFATTNNLEALDEALVREGRFDLKFEVGYMDSHRLHEYLSRFYPEAKLEQIKDNVVPAKVQKMVFDRKTYMEIIKEVKVD